jgi:endonuclease-8
MSRIKKQRRPSGSKRVPMPEGPEIRRAADELAGALAGRVAGELFFAFDELKPYQEKLAGEKIVTVEARGKALLIRFANHLNIYSHNQLYGKWMIREARNFPNTNRQLRLAIHTGPISALLYSASDIQVLRDDELDTHPFLSKLGPDPLDESVTVEHVVDLFLHKQFHRRKLANLLLDQRFLAGIGNYLRSEILFVGQTHPLLRPADCTPEQIRQLARAAIILPRQSYQTQGITNDLRLVEKLRQEGYSRNEYRFRVFNRVNEPCYVCGTPIMKDEIGGRRLYFCPNCQKL